MSTGRGNGGEGPLSVMGSRSSLSVALTIDAEHPDRGGWAAGNCESMLATLNEFRVKATFFLQGRWVSANPALARRIAADGHLIGNHSHFHAQMPLLTGGGQETDLLAAQQVIQEVVGVDPRPWFRSPFGAGLGDPGLTTILARHGYRNIGWDVDGADWEEDRSAQAVEDQIVSGCLARTGLSIVLLHSWPRAVADALPSIISRLQSAGVEFGPLEGDPTPQRQQAAPGPGSVG